MADVEEKQHDVQQFLMFHLSGQTYGVGIRAIREIIEYQGLTPIPLTPPFLRGVINLRGAVVPVLDLAVRFGREPTGVNRRTCIVIVEYVQGQELHLLGVIVDGVTEVLDTESGEVESQPAFGTGLRADFVVGMLRREQGFIPILDIAAILATDELVSLMEETAENPSLARAG